VNITNDDDNTSLIIACRQGYLNIIKLLLSYNASVHHYNYERYDALLECITCNLININGNDNNNVTDNCNENDDDDGYNNDGYNNDGNNSSKYKNDNSVSKGCNPYGSDKIEMIRLLVNSGICHVSLIQSQIHLQI